VSVQSAAVGLVSGLVLLGFLMAALRRIGWL
jgi:hypothetical protein